jgi:D-alanyl-D-alanine carboxypeptidase/D-alanyl-D-alanine-endopeptidase (penicillin-binding protein 4)
MTWPTPALHRRANALPAAIRGFRRGPDRPGGDTGRGRSTAVRPRTALALVVAITALTLTAPVSQAQEANTATVASDWDGDGTADIVAPTRDGRLWHYRGDGSSGFSGARTQLGSGWNARDHIRMVGDWDGVAGTDMIARDTATGDLWLYSGDGQGGFRTYHPIGRGWQIFSHIFSPGDWDGDGNIDLLGVVASDGALRLYPGDGSGGFGRMRVIGTGWQGYDSLVKTHDFDGDGLPDFLVRDSGNGDLLLQRGDGAGGFLPSVRVGSGWQIFTGLLGVGDFSGDGKSDVLARSADGSLLLYRGDGAGGWISPFPVVGTGWNALAFPGATPAWVAGASDWSGDGLPDIVSPTRDGRLWLYRGDGDSGFSGARTRIGNGWDDRDHIRLVGDWDGRPGADIIARDPRNGDLWLYSGDANGGFRTYYRIGAGWNIFSQIFSPGDWDGDGNVDLLATVISDGSLRLYRGDGAGGFLGMRVIGAGWQTYDGLTLTGDFDGDGRPDFLARDTATGDLRLYRGDGAGGFLPTVRVGTGWQIFTGLLGVGDWSGDGCSDVLARRADGSLTLYRGDCAGGWSSPYPTIGTGWGVMGLPGGTPTWADLRMASKLTARATTSRFGTAFSGVVIDAATDRVLWSRNGTTLRRPASNVKLVTAANALTTFGTSARFTTSVRQGTWPKQVVLVGAGDPSLSSAQVDSLAEATADDLRARGYSTGVRAYIDDDIFPREFTPATGWLPSYVPDDFTPIRGLVRDQRDVTNTAADAGRYFRDRLRAYGITADFAGYQDSPSSQRTIADSSGVTTATTVSRMLLGSDNEIAESLHRLVAIEQGRGNTWDAARAGQAATIQSQRLSTGSLYDGSGLSRSNRMSALQLARIMDRGLDTRHRELWPMRSAQAMPTAGQTGTLRAAYGRFTTAQSKCAAGKVWAKTGSLMDVVALTGFTKGTDGRVKVFSFLVNGKSSSLALRQSVDMLAATVNGCY